jgi:hypothetical protein
MKIIRKCRKDSRHIVHLALLFLVRPYTCVKSLSIYTFLKMIYYFFFYPRALHKEYIYRLCISVKPYGGFNKGSSLVPFSAPGCTTNGQGTPAIYPVLPEYPVAVKFSLFFHI